MNRIKFDEVVTNRAIVVRMLDSYLRYYELLPFKFNY